MYLLPFTHQHPACFDFLYGNLCFSLSGLPLLKQKNFVRFFWHRKKPTKRGNFAGALTIDNIVGPQFTCWRRPTCSSPRRPTYMKHITHGLKAPHGRVGGFFVSEGGGWFDLVYKGQMCLQGMPLTDSKCRVHTHNSCLAFPQVHELQLT